MKMDISTVSQVYSQLSKDNLQSLSDIYHQEVIFEDSAHTINGWANLKRYFENLYQNVNSCDFDIHSEHQADGCGFLVWTMHLSHPKLKGGQPVAVKGVSHVKFADGKVIHHRDYFDMGEMLYENLPVLGSVIRTIKQRLGQ
jgi:limonene-1,2-epoxide hydrolase